MKRILILITFCTTLLYSCGKPANNSLSEQKPSIVVQQPQPQPIVNCDSLLAADAMELIDCRTKSDSINALKIAIDSLKTKLFLSDYKIEKVKFYLNICLKDKTQDKFLKGWIRRATE